MHDLPLRKERQFRGRVVHSALLQERVASAWCCRIGLLVVAVLRCELLGDELVLLGVELAHNGLRRRRMAFRQEHALQIARNDVEVAFGAASYGASKGREHRHVTQNDTNAHSQYRADLLHEVTMEVAVDLACGVLQ